MAYDGDVAQQQAENFDPSFSVGPIPISAEQQAIWNAEAEKRMTWEREQMASANKRQSRATALQLAMQLAGPLNGDHQAIVRAAREFCAFIEE